MRWSLVFLGVFLAVSLPLYPSVDGANEEGARVRRDDGESQSLLEKLFNAIMGGDNSSDEDDDDYGDGDNYNGEDDDDDGATSNLNSTTTTIEPYNGTDRDEDSTEIDSTESHSTETDSTETDPSETDSTKTGSTTQKQTTGVPSTTLSPECQRPNDLGAYCTVSDDFGYYMQWDTSTNNLVSKVFSDTVINQLLTMCQPGSWCLSDDYIDSFGASMINFFSSPICDAGLQGCIADMLTKRAECHDMMKLSVLSDSLSLLCQMAGITGEVTPECFGHTIATLHVTMADEIRATSKDIQFGDEFCLGAYVGMTRKFMCTLEECPSHQKLFRDFPPWQWFMNDEVAIKDICQLDQVCGDKELKEEEQTTLSATYFLSSSTNFPETQTENMVTEATKVEQATQNIDKPIFILQTSDASTRLLIGVVTGSLIGVLVLMILIGTLVKRMRKKYPFSSKDGYSKLHNEDFD